MPGTSRPSRDRAPTGSLDAHPALFKGGTARQPSKSLVLAWLPHAERKTRNSARDNREETCLVSVTLTRRPRGQDPLARETRCRRVARPRVLSARLRRDGTTRRQVADASNFTKDLS